MFYWLYETTHSSGYKNRPLILWLQVCLHSFNFSPDLLNTAFPRSTKKDYFVEFDEKLAVRSRIGLYDVKDQPAKIKW